MKLLESSFLKPTLVESDSAKLPKGVLRRITYPICNIGVKNHNGRKYEAKVWDNVEQDKDIVEKIAHRTLYGQAEHPKDDTQSNLEKTSHIVSKLYRANDLFEGKEILKEFAVVDLINTPYGQIINALFEAGCDVGVSTRADGDVEEKIDESGDTYNNVIAETYKFRALDFTADPSTFAPYAVKMESNIVHAVQAGVGEKKMSKEYGLAMLESFNGTEAKEIKRRISGCDGKCAGKCNMVLNGKCACQEEKNESKEQALDYFSQPDHERYFRREVDRIGGDPLEEQYSNLAASMVNYAKKHGTELKEKDAYEAIPALLKKCGLSMEEKKVEYRLTTKDITDAMKELNFSGIDYNKLSDADKEKIKVKAREKYVKKESKINEMYEVPADKRQEALSKLNAALKSNSVVGTPTVKIIKNIIKNIQDDGFLSILDLDTFMNYTGIKHDELKPFKKDTNECVAPDIKLQDELANAKKEKNDFVVKFYPSNEIKSFKNEKELIPEVASYDGNVLVMAIGDKNNDTPVYYGDAKLFHIKKAEDVKERRIVEDDYKYKSDEDIEKEFAGFKITKIEIRRAPNEEGTASGYINIEFPEAGESVGGGQEPGAEISDHWLQYSFGSNIAFDNWYPDKVYTQLVKAIRDEIDKQYPKAKANEAEEKLYRIDELPEHARMLAIDYYQDDVIGEESEYKTPQEYEEAATDENIIRLMNRDKYLFNDKGELKYAFGHANESLDEKIVKVGDKWQVQSHAGKNMGEYATEAEALKRLKQVEFFKHQKESIDDDLTRLKTVAKEVFADKDIRTHKTGYGWELHVHGQPSDTEALRVAKAKLDPYLKNIKNVSVGGQQEGDKSWLVLSLTESWDIKELFEAVNEKRTYTNVGQERGYSKEDIDNAISQVKWEPFRTEHLPFSQGEAIKAVVKATGIPVKTPKGLGIKRMSLHGGIKSQQQKDEHEGESGFYALDVQYSNGMAQIYIADDGVHTVVVASDFQPNIKTSTVEGTNTNLLDRIVTLIKKELPNLTDDEARALAVRLETTVTQGYAEWKKSKLSSIDAKTDQSAPEKTEAKKKIDSFFNIETDVDSIWADVAGGKTFHAFARDGHLVVQIYETPTEGKDFADPIKEETFDVNTPHADAFFNIEADADGIWADIRGNKTFHVFKKNGEVVVNLYDTPKGGKDFADPIHSIYFSMPEIMEEKEDLSSVIIKFIPEDDFPYKAYDKKGKLLYQGKTRSETLIRGQQELRNANEAKASVTKSDYVIYLNEVGIPDDDKKSNGGRIPDNAEYGEWLRRNDPIAFNVGWNDYSRGRNEARIDTNIACPKCKKEASHRKNTKTGDEDVFCKHCGYDSTDLKKDEAKIHTVGMKVMVSKDGTNSMPAEIVETSSRTGEKATHGHYWKDHNAYLVKYANETTEYVPADMVKIVEAEQESNPSTIEAGNLLVANKDMVAEQLEAWADTFGAIEGEDDEENEADDAAGDKIWGLAQKLRQGKKLNSKNIAFMIFHLRQAFYDPSDMNDKLDNDKDREAMKAILATDVGPLQEREKKFDLGHGSLGNGVTVWNRAKEVHGDYEKVAHIGEDRKITWYVKNPPADVVKYVEDIAKGPNPAAATSQPDKKVFSESRTYNLKEGTEDIGSGKLPNKYYVTGSSDYLVETEPGSFDWASDTILKDEKFKESVSYGSFDTFAEAIEKVKEVENSEMSNKPSPSEINTVIIEDHISGEVFSAGWKAIKNRHPYAYHFYSHKETKFTEEALAKKGIQFESRKTVSFGIKESVMNEVNFDVWLKQFEAMFSNASEDTKKKFIERIGANIVVPVKALSEAKITTATLQEMVKVKEQRHIKAIADLNKSHAAEVKALQETVAYAKKEVEDFAKSCERKLIEQYVDLTVEYSGLTLNENALTLLKQCSSKAEVDEMLGNMHRALSENALHSKADSLTVNEHIPVDPEMARIVHSVTKAFEGINQK